jgi:hypothetical protein
VKRFLEIGGVVAGVVLIAFGVAAIVLGTNGKNTVSNELKLQQITGSPDMTPVAITAAAKEAGLNLSTTPIPKCTVANLPVNSGDRARCFAEYMRIHTLESTHGIPYSKMGMYVAKKGTPKSQLTADGATSNSQYAETDPTTGAPVSNAARNIWVTETALTTALNSSYMAEQMANFGIVVGVALLLSGFGFLILALGGALEGTPVFAAWTEKRKKTQSSQPLGV